MVQDLVWYRIMWLYVAADVYLSHSVLSAQCVQCSGTLCYYKLHMPADLCPSQCVLSARLATQNTLLLHSLLTKLSVGTDLCLPQSVLSTGFGAQNTVLLHSLVTKLYMSADLCPSHTVLSAGLGTQSPMPTSAVGVSLRWTIGS